LFLTPVSCMAAINLFAARERFSYASQVVVWVTGAGVALTSAAGALLGGYIADRVDRAVLYVCSGLLGVRSLWRCVDAAHSAFLHNRRAGV